MKSFSVELSNGSVLSAPTLERIITEINDLLKWNDEIKILKITKWTGSNTSTTLKIGDNDGKN